MNYVYIKRLKMIMLHSTRLKVSRKVLTINLKIVANSFR